MLAFIAGRLRRAGKDFADAFRQNVVNARVLHHATLTS